MLPIERLISHRFRGFAPHENTVEGLVKALDFGVQHLEFDIRVTRCGTPLIYHDEFALDGQGQKHHLADLTLDQVRELGGAFAHMPEADHLFDIAARHPNNTASFLIDIKDLGFEVEINALVHLAGLQDRSVYVSWIPEVLYRLHDMAPDIPLCLSHWCEQPNDTIRALHHVDEAIEGHIPRISNPYIHGQRRGWYVSGGLKGEMLDILVASKGSVCVPQDMISRPLSDYYHAHGLQVSAFSFIDWPTIKAFDDNFDIDLYFIDNKKVFDEIR